jgi:hypothetical protein
MGCIYNDNRTGKCQVNDGSIEMTGIDEIGNCICDEDESPIDSCESFVSDDE